MEHFKISQSQAQIIAQEILAYVHIYAEEHSSEFDDFVKNMDNPHSGLDRDKENDRKEVKHDT